MKKYIALILAVLMIASCFAGCGTSGKTIVVGYTIYAPMNYKDDSGKLIGFDTELAEAVFENLGYKVLFQEIVWKNKYTDLNSGAIDCIWNGFTSNTKDSDGVERSEKVDFTYAYLDNAQCIVVKAEDLAEYTSAASLAGKKGTAEAGSAGETYAKSVTTDYVDVPVQTDTFREVMSGAAKFAVVDRLLAENIVGNGDYAALAIVEAIEIEKEVYSIGCKKDGDLDEKINAALVELLNEGEIERLATKYNVRVTDTLMAMKTAD